jgi:GT2 family glycosyltransferase
VIDNGSEPEQLLRLRKGLADYGGGSFLLPLDSNTGFNGGVNIALEWQRQNGSDHLCVLNSDLTLKEDGWLDKWVNFYNCREKVGIIGLGQAHFISKYGTYDYRGKVKETVREAQWITGCALFISEDIVRSDLLMDK